MKDKLRIGDTEDGAEVAPDTIFLGWNVLENRSDKAVECPKCGGFAKETDCTKAEINSDLNCGRTWACCVAAFKCSKCGTRLLTNRPAPEME